MQEQVTGKVHEWQIFRRLATYIRPYWRWVAISVVFLLVGSGLQVLGPLLTREAVDRYLAPTVSRGSRWLDPFLPQSPTVGIWVIGLLYLVVLGLGLLIEYTQLYLTQRTGQHAMADLRRQLVDCLHRLDISFYDRTPAGRLVTRATTDIDTLNELFASGLVAISADVLLIGFSLLAMWQLSASLTLLLLASAPAIIFVAARFRREVTDSYRKIRVAIARINSFIQEHVTGIIVVQLFNREQRSLEEFRGYNREHMEAYKQAIKAYGWFFPAVEFIGTFVVAALLVYGGAAIQRGELSLGVLIAFFQYGLRFFRPIQDLSEKYNLIQSAVTAAERIFALLDTPIQIRAPKRPRPFPSGPVPVVFDHVWFAYQSEDWVLKDVSFRIEPGETIAIVGHTGAGKTTLVSLLLRFYDVQRGAIRIGDVDVREMDPRELRRHFGVVLQEPYLFTGTIEENIRLGSHWIEDEHLVAAAAQVNLLDYIESLPGGFAHRLHERGGGLSTGQKQLINFARALAHNPRFLILDEATSSVDPETEFRIREALARMIEGRTSIIIAHRLSTIQRANRIFVLHKGELREVGTHQELLARQGIYWRLYQLQYKSQEDATLPLSKS